MPVIINISTGEARITYPSEFDGELKLYKTPLYKEIFAVFRILDAVYNCKEPYKIEPTPYYVFGGERMWKYVITSPLMPNPIHITEERKDLTPERGSFDRHDWVVEYQIDMGGLFILRQHSAGIMTYLVKLFTEPAKAKYEATYGEEQGFKQLEQQRTNKLIALADKFSPYSTER